jgi:hypothetical protein
MPKELFFNPDFEFKMSKNLIRSKHQSRSLEGPIKLAFHKGCEIDVLNGPNLKKQYHGRYEFHA